MMTILAEVAADGVSGKVVVGIIGSIFTGLALLAGKLMERRRAENAGEVRVRPPVPTVPIEKQNPPPTWHQFEGLDRRVGVIESHLKDVRQQTSDQFVKLLEVGAEREARLRDVISASARATHERIDLLLRKEGK